jgi:hypothetical protein
MTFSGSMAAGLGGCLFQKLLGCQMLLVLAWCADSCSMGPPMMSATWSTNSSR